MHQTAHRSIIPGLIFLPLFSAWGQGDSLSHWLRTALENNPMITAAQANVEARQYEIDIAPSLPDPAVSGGYFVTPVETRVGPQQGRIGVSQTIPWPGKLLIKKTIARKEHKAAQEALAFVKAGVLAEVRGAYAEYYALGKEIVITKENMKLLQGMENALLSRYSSSTVSQVSLLRIQVEMAVLEDRITSLHSEEVKAREKCIALLNLPADADLPIPAYLPRLPVPARFDSLIDRTYKLNPALERSRREVEVASAQVELAKQSFAPDLMFMTDYIFTGKNGSTMNSFSGKDGNPWIIGGSITVPIWTGSKVARIKKAMAIKEMQEETAENIEKLTESNTVSFVEEYNDALRKIAFYTRTLIPQSKRTAALVEKAYVNGKATVIDFLDAQRTHLNLQVMLEKQQARREMIAGKIDMLLGGELTFKMIDAYRGARK